MSLGRLPTALRGQQHAGFAILANSKYAFTTGAFAQEKESTSGPPTPPGQVGSEKQVKFGVNTPRSAKQFVSETGHAASGLAESIGNTIKATATAVKRSLGMTNEKPQSEPRMHGADGMMEYAPPGVKKPGGPATDRAHAEAKYEEISATEKPNFPKGEQSVNEQFPDMAEAAKLQNIGGQKQDVKLDKNLHEMGP